jgi:hypothetical protein
MAFAISVQKGVRIDASLYATHVAMFCQVMRKTVAEVVKDEARLLARDACDLFPPFSGADPQITKGGEGGFGLKARNKGQAAVNRDIRNIFAPLAQAPAGLVAQRGNLGIFDAWVRAKANKPPPHAPSWLFDAFKTSGMVTQADFDLFKQKRHGNLAGAGNIMLQESEGQIAAIHRMVRGPKHYYVGKNRKPDFYVRDWKMVERYIKKVQTRVGRLKSGWYWASKKLGPPSPPQSMWIEGQGSREAIVQPMLIGPSPKVKIGNAIAKDHSQGWHLFQKAWNHRGYAMRVRMLKTLSGKKNHGTLLQLTQKLKGFNVTQIP